MRRNGPNRGDSPERHLSDGMGIYGEPISKLTFKKVPSLEVDHRKPCRFPGVVLLRGV
jgi:hypothetical protein